MKIQLIVIPLILLTIASCNQSHKEESYNSEDSTKSEQSSIDEITMGVDQPGVYFANLKDDEEIRSPVVIQMRVRGMFIEPAGKVNEGRGHHNIIIDGTFIEKGKVVPMDKTHLHFGKGQVTDTLELAPGKHILTLQFADGVHDSYGKDWSKSISITVLE